MKAFFLKIWQYILPSAPTPTWAITARNTKIDITQHKRYTRGRMCVDSLMYVLLDNGVCTGAFVTVDVIDNIYDDCEITGGHFYSGIFYSGTFTGGQYHGGTFYGGAIAHRIYGNEYYECGIVVDNNMGIL